MTSDLSKNCVGMCLGSDAFRKLFVGLAITLGLLESGLSGAYAQTLKIGVIAGLTGPAAAFGLATAGGPKIVAAEINAKGGLDVAGKKYQVEVVAYDDQYQAAGAVAAYSRLVRQDGVKFVIVASSAATLALKQSAEDDKVLVLTSGVTLKAFDEKTKYMFRLYSPPNYFIGPLSSWMRANLKERRLVIVNPNDESGWAQTEASVTIYKKDGFDVVGTELYERSAKDFQPLLTRVLAMKPEIIDLSGTVPGTAGLIVRQARELGFKGVFTQTGAGAPSDIVAAAGRAAAEGTIQMLYGDAANPSYQQAVAAYKKLNNGQEPHNLFVPYLDATNVLLRAIQKAGDVNDTAKVAAAFSQVLPMKALQGDEITLGGKSIIGHDHQFMTVNYIAVIKNGDPVIVGKIR